MRFARALRVLALALTLAACAPRPVPANPALWEVTGPGGEKGWLFGTIHSLNRPALWRDKAIDAALHKADVVLVETADVENPAAIRAVFGKLAHSPGHGVLSSRVDPAHRGRLATLLKKAGLDDAGFADTETWAAALTLAQALSPELDTRYGIDRAVLEAAKGKPVRELEGTRAQLAIFDALPEDDQRALLDAVIDDAASLAGQSPDLAEAWRKGDMATIEGETRRGMLADPDLRQALFTGRNSRWAREIELAMKARWHPFVAVGAAHMAGPEGLPAMLAKSGYTVRRVQ